MGRKLVLAVFAASFAMFMAMAGCASSQPAAQSASASSSEAAEQVADVTIGQESNTAKTLVMKNATGKTIDTVALGETGTEADSLISLEIDGGEWADGQTAAIYYEPTGASFFDIQLTSGEETFMLHNFNFEGVENIEVMMEGDVAYVTFERGGSVVSSLSEEMSIHDEAVALEEAAAAEAEALAAEAEAQTYYESTPTYNEPAPAAQPAQTQDSCVEGGVVLR
ncbi:MAG: hypothetical protein J5818_02220 [Eggerthellaceae bacterium]|nr:hypothetical protein [Eggerthellaceae bacterium]